MYDKVKKIKNTREYLARILDREPNEEELRHELGADLGEFEDVKYMTVDEEEEREIAQLRFRLNVQNERLFQSRQEKGLSQAGLAELIGNSNSFISHIETCRRYPDEETKSKISAVLNKSVEYLFPEWLNYFTDHWKNVERDKLVKFDTLPLAQKSFLQLSESHSLEENAEKEVLKLKVREAIKSSNLRERELKILDLYFGLSDGRPRTFKEVSEHMGGPSPKRIISIYHRALQKIQGNCAFIGDLKDAI